MPGEKATKRRLKTGPPCHNLLTQGTYYVSITGVGEGPDPTTGYTNYDSAGYYTLTLGVFIGGAARRRRPLCREPGQLLIRTGSDGCHQHLPLRL